VSFQKEELTPETKLSVAEFADLFGFPPTAVISAVQNQRSKLSKPFYTLKDLTARWGCSRGTVASVLKSHSAIAMDLGTNRAKTKKSKKVFPAATILRIEKERMITVAA
jgi:hypothetical protein